MTSPANGSDRAAERALTLQRIAHLPAKARLDALLSAEDAGALVRASPPESLYAAIVEVGLADATEIVQLASPSQFRAFVDLAAWRRDRLDAHTVLEWLRAARGDEPEDLLRKLHALDVEVLEALLREMLVVHDLEENPDPDVQGVTMDSADGHFRLEFTVEGPQQAGLRALLMDLMGEDPFAFTRLLEAVRWEVPSELEEIALRFRWARLADLGFPDRESAASLYASLPIPPAPPSSQPAGLVRAPGTRPDLVAAALDGLGPDERPTAEEELRGVYNAALVADGADPGDLDALRAAAERARDTLGLGLEWTTGGDPARAAEVLRATPFRRLFQIGFSLGLRLKHRAERLAARPLARVDGEWMLMPDLAAVIGALRRPRPLRALTVPGAEPVPFRSLRELAQTEALLARAEAQVALLSALLGGSEDAARTTLAGLGPAWPTGGAPAILAAALAHALLDGAPRVAPVASERTEALGRAFLRPGASAALATPTVDPDAAARAGAVLASVAPGVADEARQLASEVLGQLADALGPALLAGPLPREASVTLPLAR